METLALIELVDRDGTSRQVLRVTQWPVRVGRGLDCDLVLDDPYVAARHVDLTWQEDGLHVVPAATLNGVRLGRARVAAGSAPPLPPNGQLTLGTTTLRVRLAGESLPPELALADPNKGVRRDVATLLGLLAFAALWQGLDLWLSSVPGEPGAALAGRYLAAPMGLVVWCALWALASKLFQHRFAFWPHMRLVLFWTSVSLVVQAAAGQLAFAFSLPVLARAGRVAFVLATTLMLWKQLCLLLPQRRRAFAITLASALVVGSGLLLADRALQQQPLVGDLYLGTLSLPAVRVARPVSADAFVKSAQPLEATLKRLAKPGDDDEESGGGDDDD